MSFSQRLVRAVLAFLIPLALFVAASIYLHGQGRRVLAQAIAFGSIVIGEMIVVPAGRGSVVAQIAVAVIYAIVMAGLLIWASLEVAGYFGNTV